MVSDETTFLALASRVRWLEPLGRSIVAASLAAEVVRLAGTQPKEAEEQIDKGFEKTCTTMHEAYMITAATWTAMLVEP